jgi:D-aminoacyl-tRNA deacylase
VISQFTLHGDMRKGRRPSYNAAAEPATRRRSTMRSRRTVARRRVISSRPARFGAHMDVTATNDGPVTLLIDSRKLF